LLSPRKAPPPQASTKIDDKDSLKTTNGVATPVSEKGKPDTTLISDEPASSRKLGLEDLNEAIESTEIMDVDNSIKESGGDDSVESDPKEADLQEDVGPDVGTSMGQQDKPDVEIDVVADEENSNPETDPVEDVDSGDSLENAHSEESAGTEGGSEKEEEEEDSGDKENEKDVVNVIVWLREKSFPLKTRPLKGKLLLGLRPLKRKLLL